MKKASTLNYIHVFSLPLFALRGHEVTAHLKDLSPYEEYAFPTCSQFTGKGEQIFSEKGGSALIVGLFV